MTPVSRPSRHSAPFAGGAFFVPNAFLDEWLPLLRDTEARVLLVVIRQTAGWRTAPGSSAHKKRDWISHSQMMRRTGRGSGAVSAAIASLVKRGWLVVEDAAGRPLPTPEDRRRYLGRLYYRLDEASNAPSTLWKTVASRGKVSAHAVRQNRGRQQTDPTTFRSL